MSLKIECIEGKKSYIYVKASGEEHEISTALIGVFDLAKKQRIYKVLLDYREVTGTVSVWSRFEFASLISVESFKIIDLCGIRPKIVLVSKKSVIDPKKFEETVARNRGSNLMVTDDIQEACKWLDVGFNMGDGSEFVPTL
jgi:hypothetical protein